MTWTIRTRGATSGTVAAEYRCPVHGVFEIEVQRDGEGDPPPIRACPAPVDYIRDGSTTCGLTAPWTITQAPGMRIARAEFKRGKSDGPRMATDMDTRALGEGQALQEWKGERARVWRDVDYKATKEFLGR